MAPEPPPLNPDALHEWIRNNLGVDLAREPMVEGHAAPFDYIRHAFFVDEYRPSASPPAAGAPPVAGPNDCVVWANRGGGKTFLGALATLLDLVFKPGIQIRILAGSMDQSQRMYAHLRRFLDPGRHPRLAEMVEGRITERRLTLRGGTVELLAQSQTSVRGTRVQKLRCDEVDLFKTEVWEASQLTTRSARCGAWEVRATIECLSTMHRPYGVMRGLVGEAAQGTRALFKWGVLDVLESCGPEHRCGSDTAAESAQTDPRPCPLLNDCQGRAKQPRRHGHIRVIDAIAQKRRVSNSVWESEMLCLRPRRSNAVVPEFNPKVHVFHDDSALRAGPVTWLAGMDFGIRRTVVLWAALDHAGVLHVVDEHNVADRILEFHIDAMRRGLARGNAAGWPRPEWVGIDPAANARNSHSGKTSEVLLREAGFAPRFVILKVRQSLELLRARFEPAHGPPRLFVHARCAQLIEDLECHRYNDRRPESEKPEKDGHDHAVDALRYLVSNLDLRHESRTSNYTRSP
ncbi:hypothetical protein PHYC_01763 [Phycisphaerales bacterium]|nr:hypothetical protein PHYC_01763 [Phycisphaerales bacterium]